MLVMTSPSKYPFRRQRALGQRPLKQRPFDGLDRILSKKAIHLPEGHPEAGSDWIRKARQSPEPLSPAAERRLFKQAMAGVRPLKANIHADPHPPTSHALKPLSEEVCEGAPEDLEGLRRLRELVEKGKGFTLAHTAEYMAGPDGRGTNHLSEALHRGRYAIQDHIDLHGMGVAEAEAALRHFFKRAVATGMRGVLIVHGRGLRSEGAPVLKKSVQDWLTRGPWRRWVAAFASAQAFDGGTGATYVLIRRSPGKKHRRRKNF
jgi:DNA-nicking Smr family endonuclease